MLVEENIFDLASLQRNLKALRASETGALIKAGDYQQKRKWGTGQTTRRGKPVCVCD